MISIVLLEPGIPGNLGAIARSMKNFGFKDLIIVNPQFDITCEETRNRAKHAQDILENARVVDELPKFDLLIGTSGKLGNDSNIPRVPITPDKLNSLVCNSCNKELNIAILFGRESCGLTNEELSKTDFLVSIPANDDYPVFNLSHAVTIILYELSKNYKEENKEKFPLATREQKNALLKLIYEFIDKQKDTGKFSTETQPETQKLVWKRIVNFLTGKEAQVLFGFFKKL